LIFARGLFIIYQEVTMKIIDQLKEGKFTCSEEEVVHYLLEHQD